MKLIRITDTLWIAAENIGQVQDNPDEGTLTIGYLSDIVGDIQVCVLMDDERDAMLNWLQGNDVDCRIDELADTPAR